MSAPCIAMPIAPGTKRTTRLPPNSAKPLRRTLSASSSLFRLYASPSTTWSARLRDCPSRPVGMWPNVETGAVTATGTRIGAATGVVCSVQAEPSNHRTTPGVAPSSYQPAPGSELMRRLSQCTGRGPASPAAIHPDAAVRCASAGRAAIFRRTSPWDGGRLASLPESSEIAGHIARAPDRVKGMTEAFDVRDATTSGVANIEGLGHALDPVRRPGDVA